MICVIAENLILSRNLYCLTVFNVCKICLVEESLAAPILIFLIGNINCLRKIISLGLCINYLDVFNLDLYRSLSRFKTAPFRIPAPKLYISCGNIFSCSLCSCVDLSCAFLV